MDARGEVLPVAILFVGVLLTILIGIHVVVVALARTAVQSAADAAAGAAQAAGPGELEREAEGELAALLTLWGARASVVVTQRPYVDVEEERGLVSAAVFGGVYTPMLGVVHLNATACAPLDDVPVSRITAPDAWEC